MTVEVEAPKMLLELEDGSFYQGYGFGASAKSVSGELVFQTGMVGYPESITDPSYEGQILCMTYPLIGNYGVPSRAAMDTIVQGIPAHFEAAKIHIAGLVVASYAGEDYSHHLATSSLGTWLEEQGIPAVSGVDTRLLTKKIREKGSMLGKLLAEESHTVNGFVNGSTQLPTGRHHQTLEVTRSHFRDISWNDPNAQNLVANGKDVYNREGPVSLSDNARQSQYVNR